jgi:WD40 repeat protein
MVAKLGFASLIAFLFLRTGQSPVVATKELSGGNFGQVEGVAFSHNGKWLASADNSGVIVVRLMDDYSLKATLHGQNFSEVAWTPDDRSLVAGGFDSLVYIWQWQSAAPAKILRYSGQVEAVAISNSGMVLAAGGGDRTIRRWMLPSLQELSALSGHTDDVYAVRVSPDGKFIVSAGRDRAIRVWDSSTGTCLEILHGHEDSVYDLAFTKEGTSLISGCRDGTVGVWNADTWKLERLLKGPENSIHGVAVSSDGRWIAGAGFDRNVWLWLLDGSIEGKALSGHRRKVSCVAFSPDGQWLASAASDTTVRLWQFR